MGAATVSTPVPASMRRIGRVWQTAAVVGLAVFTAHTLTGSRMGLDRFFNAYLYNGLILLGLAACAIRTWRVRDERAAWLALTLGVASWSVAEVLFDFVYGGSPPYPSVADGFYLAFYPCCYVALMLLIRSRVSEFSRTLWFDGVMAAVASTALGAAVLFEVVVQSTDGSPALVVTNLAYPLGDILLLSAVIGIFVLTGFRPGRTWALIGAGLAASAVADGVFLFQTATDAYSEGTILDALWPASMLLLAAAAWQQPRKTAVELEGRPLLATPLACGAIGLGVFTYDHFHPLNFLAASLAGATIIAVIVRTGMTFRENSRILDLVRDHAVTDALTGLGNRRKFVAELDGALAGGPEGGERLLAIYDLDGFKLYNDAFGHPAGDVLLRRLAANLTSVVGEAGSCYRLGGDEFCVVADVPPDEREAFLESTAQALGETGEAFTVTSSYGGVMLSSEVADSSEALRLADQRMYAHKRERFGRGHPHEMLLRALYEREPGLRRHVESVEEMACVVGAALGISGTSLQELRLAARLHDVGKLAIPDAVLKKPGPLDVTEWAFIKEHTVIGQRILDAAPGSMAVAKIVRATHERWDGDGYPDGLVGEEIPLLARIVAVCDAFSAMTSPRPYRLQVSRELAIEELHRCAGSQFDPAVVAAFCRKAEEAVAGWGIAEVAA